MPSPTHPLIREFLRSHRQDWTDQHRYNAASHLNRWHRFCELHGLDITDVTTDHCEAFLMSRDKARDDRSLRNEYDWLSPGFRREPVDKGTRTKDYQFLKWLYEWADAEGETEPFRGRRHQRHAMDGVKGPGKVARDPRRTPHISEADYNSLMASFDKRLVLDCRNAAICSLMYHTGLRRSMISGLDLDRLDLDARVLEVYNSKTGDWWRVPITIETSRHIERYLRRRGTDQYAALFLGSLATKRPDGRIMPTAISEMLERRGDKLGIHIPAHSFRRAMSINLKRQGVENSLIQQIGCWNDPSMPGYYQANASQDLAIAKFHEVDITARQTPAPNRRRLRAVG